MTELTTGSLTQRSETPKPTQVLAKLLLVAFSPLLLSAGYVFAALSIFALTLAPVAEAVVLALLWTGTVVISIVSGAVLGRHTARPAPWWATAAVYLFILPFAVSPLLGPESDAVAITVTAWGAVLLLLVLLTWVLATRPNVILAITVGSLGGTLLVMTAAFLSARLHLSEDLASWPSMPFWLPIAVTDHSIVPASLVSRLDALRVASGLSVTLPIATALLLSYAMRFTRPPAARPTSGLMPSLPRANDPTVESGPS